MPLFLLVIEKGSRREGDQRPILPRTGFRTLLKGWSLMEGHTLYLETVGHYCLVDLDSLFWIVFMITKIVADVSHSNVDYLL